ncbi:MAG: alanine--tRNA ligase [Gammaproteobacteria bacterium]|nr:alanine--tRNA ligase [Gammaproteobacteria bacterium]
MKLAEIRTRFLNYFNEHGHAIVKSSPLVPANDPTLLFTNAGMVQFKDVFLGTDQRPYTKAVSVQRCLRAGGKHNDLENVGYTARHHTFFEMLGNFSFGDYFKREAITLAWNFLTKEIQLPAERLWVTVYEEDDEAADIWLNELKINPKQFSRCGKKDNFWAMGDTGPCGPCTEIFYDHGPEFPGGPPGSIDGDLDRYIEIWNLVFMQYNRDAEGELTPLPKQSVDTGMGIERLAAVVQGVHSNYEIDLFVSLIKAVAKVTLFEDLSNQSLRVIADHIRACSFLITDGVMPSNEGRGYVLRRIIRRAVRHGHKLGVKEPFFYKLVSYLCAEMGKAYPELVAAQSTIEKILEQEEIQFSRTLDIGLKKLSVLFLENQKNTQNNIINGGLAFELYDTYGFPIDLTMDIAREYNFSVDLEVFEKHLANQRERSKQGSNFKASTDSFGAGFSDLNIATDFTGYEQLASKIEVTATLNSEQDNLDSLSQDSTGYIVTASTPFYAEGGGQVGDQGVLTSDNGFQAQVLNTIKIHKAHLHQVKVTSGKVKVGDVVIAQVDIKKRAATARNHTATHLLHAALRKILGPQVIQKGSYVGPDYLRFDFAYYQAIDKSVLDLIEQEVNIEILKNTEASVELMDIDQALNSGAIALFGEKYADKVRVLNFGHGYSVELCGGTHTDRSGDIGLFIIISESSAASGIRRIEAITGDTARLYLKERDYKLRQIGDLLKTHSDSENLLDKIKQLQLDYNRLAKTLDVYKQQEVKQQGRKLLNQVIELSGVKVLVARLEGSEHNAKNLRETLDQLKSELQKAVIVLALAELKVGEAKEEGYKVNLIAGVTNNCTDRLHAGKLISIVAVQLGGKGGGRPDMAQAGGSCHSLQELDQVLATVMPSVEQLLKN